MAGSKRQLLIATTNPGKVAEIAALLSQTDWQVVPLPEGMPEFVETGETFAENARGKALYYSQRTGLPALADDSGIQIDALGGEPGVYSARYIDPDIPQSRRNQAVLERLAEVPAERRGARFVCHLVLADAAHVLHETTGTCKGRIAGTIRGDRGFGYDPIFLVPALDRTFAELDREQKSALSHRGRAVRAMVEFLRGWSPGQRDDVS